MSYQNNLYVTRSPFLFCTQVSKQQIINITEKEESTQTYHTKNHFVFVLCKSYQTIAKIYVLQNFKPKLLIMKTAMCSDLLPVVRNRKNPQG